MPDNIILWNRNGSAEWGKFFLYSLSAEMISERKDSIGTL